MNDDTPPFKGGQGRSSESVTNDARVVAYIVLAVFVLVAALVGYTIIASAGQPL